MTNRLPAYIFFTSVLSLLSLSFVYPACGETKIFGPVFYIRGTGEPERVIERFTVQNPGNKFTLNIQQGEGKRGRVSSAVIDINGERVVSPEEFSKQVDTITRPVNLKGENEIAVEVRGEPGTSIVITILWPEVPSITETVPPSGGTVSLEGYASVIFPAGAFTYNTDVTISVTSSPETQDVYSVTTEIDETGPRLPYEVRINSGLIQPSTSFDVILYVPDSFLTTLPSNAKVQVFVQIYQDGEHEVLDNFYYGFPSTFDPVSKTIRVTLLKEAFTNLRHVEDTYEAIVIMGITFR